MEQITLNSALRKKKTLDSRIIKAIDNLQSIGVVTKGSKVQGTLLAAKDFEDASKAQLKSILDLLAEKDYLSSAITKKNLEVTTEIEGKTYTLAELILIQRNMELRRLLLTTLKQQHVKVIREYEHSMEDVEKDANTMLLKKFESTVDEAKSRSNDEALEAYKSYKLLNEPKLVDALNSGTMVSTMEVMMDNLVDTLDSRISDLNATNMIDYDTSLFRLKDVYAGKF